MSEQIKIGDLVMVVRGHACLLARFGGVPFTVTAIHQAVNGGWYCPKCRTHYAGGDEPGAQPDFYKKGPAGIPLSWLKKIDPPADAVSEDARKPIEEEG